MFQQVEDTLSTDLRTLISNTVVLLIVVIGCTIKYSISNINVHFLKPYEVYNRFIFANIISDKIFMLCFYGTP